MQIRVHVRVPALEIPLDQQLVLLSVAPGQHKDVFRGDEPVELFEPHHLPRTSNARSASKTPGKGCKLRCRGTFRACCTPWPVSLSALLKVLSAFLEAAFKASSVAAEVLAWCQYVR